MNEITLKEIQEQMEIADELYHDSIENINLEELLNSTIAKKKAKAHICGMVIEQYFKALIVWKGGTWQEMKKLSHNLLELYKLLDNEGKKILLKMFDIDYEKFKKKETPVLISSNPFISKYFLTNGKYDGEYNFPKQLSQEMLNLEYFEQLLLKVNVPSLRYANSQFVLSNKDLIRLIDLSNNMHVLSKLARGEKEQTIDYKKNR